ncbi:MAG: MATE family efflux transporter [Lachnospiraceae bacterium]|nr:MATE family efflux transporter [Lachnospiraceae bacterium]
MFSSSQLKKLIVPLMIEQLLIVMVGMVDTIMISPYGEAAVSGISLVDSINSLLTGMFSALATGGAVVAAQYIGQKSPDKACRASNQLILAVLAVSGTLAVLSLVGNRAILQLIYRKIEADVMTNARTYFYLSALSYPFLAVYSAGTALFRAMGDSKISMKTSIAMNIINIIGNALLLYCLRLGVLGAALATLVSRIAASVIVTRLLLNQERQLHLNPGLRLGYAPEMIKRILRIGIPNGLENSIFQIGKLIVAGLVSGFGTAAITANAVANTVCSFEVIPGNAIGLAMITIVGQCVGAHDTTAVKKYTWKLLKYANLAVFAVSALVAALVGPICSAYRLLPETEEIARQIILYHSLCCMLIWPASFTLPNALRAANDVKFTMLTSIITMWSCRIGLSYVLALYCNLGVLGVWIAMTIDWAVRAAVFVTRFVRGSWKKHAGLPD